MEQKQKKRGKTAVLAKKKDQTTATAQGQQQYNHIIFLCE